MECARVRDILMACIAGELADKQAHQVREHLEACKSCRQEYESSRRTSAALQILTEEEPAPALIVGVRHKLGAKPRSSRLRLAPLAAALVVPLLALLAVIWMWQKPVPENNPGLVSKPPQPKMVKTAERPLTAVPDRPRPPKHIRPARHTHKVRLRPVPAPQVAQELPDPIAQPVEEFAPSPEPAIEPDDGKSQIVIALQPREPEILLIRTGGENGKPETSLTVVREFDVSGNVVAVTIDGRGATPGGAPGS